MYVPKPIETEGIVLPPELTALIERLAENTHEVWAAKRLEQGWTLGPKRDDELKKHPCLIPFNQLPESEKAIDRKTVTGTLAAMLALGYRIQAECSSLTGGSMSTTNTREKLEALEAHLSSAVLADDRGSNFDLDDIPDKDFLSSFTELDTALSWLNDHVGEKWRKADQEALKSQKRHRWFARFALSMGTISIVLAVVQLAIELTASQFSRLALIIEAVAITAALVAVILGLVTRADRRWLAKRHLAERLRMLKFRALEQLFCKDPKEWEAWVATEMEQLASADDFNSVKKWSNAGEIEPTEMKPCVCSVELAEALTTYYHHKRLAFQGNYFKSRAEKNLRLTHFWRRLNLPVFLTSVGFVLAHFVAERLSHDAGDVSLKIYWKNIGIWCVALAAIIPIVATGVRAWFAAFQVPLSASLFAAKYQALQRAITTLKETPADIQATVSHISRYEHFLEHEHRDWLRLLLETEWFL